MNNRIDRSIQLRAQEIANTSSEPITTVAAVKQALRERFGDDIDALYDAAATSAVGALRSLKGSTHHLPPQDGLFDIPQVIVVSTEDGDLVVPKAQASTGHVRQWQREGQQHHSVQLTRFKRFGKDLQAVEDHDDEIPWSETLPVLGDRKRKELEAGE